MIRRSNHGRQGEEWCLAYVTHTHVGPLVIWWPTKHPHLMGWIAALLFIVLLALMVGPR